MAKQRPNFEIDVDYYTSQKNGESAKVIIYNAEIYKINNENGVISFRILLDNTYPVEISEFKNAVAKLAKDHKIPAKNCPTFTTGEEMIDYVINDPLIELTDDEKQNLVSNSRLLNKVIVKSKLKAERITDRTFVDRKAKPVDINTYINQYPKVNLKLTLGKNYHPKYGTFLTMFCGNIQFLNPPLQYDSGFEAIDDDEINNQYDDLEDDIPF